MLGSKLCSFPMGEELPLSPVPRQRGRKHTNRVQRLSQLGCMLGSLVQIQLKVIFLFKKSVIKTIKYLEVQKHQTLIFSYSYFAYCIVRLEDFSSSLYLSLISQFHIFSFLCNLHSFKGITKHEQRITICSDYLTFMGFDVI